MCFGNKEYLLSTPTPIFADCLELLPIPGYPEGMISAQVVVYSANLYTFEWDGR